MGIVEAPPPKHKQFQRVRVVIEYDVLRGSSGTGNKAMAKAAAHKLAGSDRLKLVTYEIVRG